MIRTLRRGVFPAAIAALLAMSAVCAPRNRSATVSGAGHQEPSPAASPSRSATPHHETKPGPKPPAVAAAARVAPPKAPAPPGAWWIEFRFRPHDVLYYLIANEYRDSGGVPPLLSFTTTIKDRRNIIQRVLPSTPSESLADCADLSWECDRYEARESGMKEESVYDSLRHTFPPPALRSLSTLPGSLCTFRMDSLGKVSNAQIKPGQITGPGGRGTPTKTTERCALSQENLLHILDDIGAYYLPQRPVKVGEEWSRSYEDPTRTFGTVTTVLRCRLRDVRKVNGGDQATIELKGEITLDPIPSTPAAPTGSQPAGVRPPPASGHRDFKIERAVCTGTVEFDLTRGELVRLDLRRELSVTADIDTKATSQSFNLGPMKLKSGASHHLRITGGHTAPPRPVIVGGPKPPPMPPEDMPRVSAAPGAKASTQPTLTPIRAAPNPQSVGAAAPPRKIPPFKRRPGDPTTPSPNVRPVASRPAATSLPFFPPHPGAKIIPPPARDSFRPQPSTAPAD